MTRAGTLWVRGAGIALLGLALALAGCGGDDDGDPGGGGGLPLDDASGGGDVAEGDTGEGDPGGGPTLQTALAALHTCAGCHGGGGCTSTEACFLDDPSLLVGPPTATSAWCTEGEATVAECSVKLMASGQMPMGCDMGGMCAEPEDIEALQAWIDAGFPD